MRILFGIGALMLLSASSIAADVGVSINIGEPGFYGQIDIGRFPAPQVLYPQPVLISPAPYAVRPGPIYLRVPPGHAKHWDKHCREYDACGRPVYFVQDRWYNDVYAPRYREHEHEHEHEHGDGEHREQGNRGHPRDHSDDDRD